MQPRSQPPHLLPIRGLRITGLAIGLLIDRPAIGRLAVGLLVNGLRIAGLAIGLLVNGLSITGLAVGLQINRRAVGLSIAGGLHGLRAF